MRSLPQITDPVIYQIRCIPTDKVYVGSAVNLRDRAKKHRSDLRLDKHHSIHLQRAWKKHGADAFVFEVLEVVANVQDLITREQAWIDSKRACNPRYGFNIVPLAGSNLGHKHTPKTRALIAEINRARSTTDEARERQRILMTERMKDPAMRARVVAATHTPEAKARQVASLKALWDDPATREKQREVMIAIRNTPEALAHQSEISKGMWQDPEWKERQRAAIKAGQTTPEARAKRSAISKAMWTDPARRERQRAVMIAVNEKRKSKT